MSFDYLDEAADAMAKGDMPYVIIQIHEGKVHTLGNYAEYSGGIQLMVEMLRHLADGLESAKPNELKMQIKPRFFDEDKN